MDILSKFPPWVFLLFAFLVILGLKATLPRAMSVYRLLILPAIFTLWNVVWLSERIHEQFSLLPLWFLGIACGSVIGWQTVASWKVKADRKHKTVTLPGSWSILIYILIIFSIRTFFAYKYETLASHIERYYIWDSLLSGVFTGIFIGRSYELYQKYKKG